MPQIEIDNTLPPPSIGTVVHYPWDAMQKGDSFFLPCAYRDMNKVRSKVAYAARSNGVKIQTRAEADGVRVWLIETING